MPFITEVPSPHGPSPGPGVFPPLHPPLEGYPHPTMLPPMMGPEGNAMIPMEPHPPMSPPIPGPEVNTIIPMEAHPPPFSPPVPGPEGNSVPFQPHPPLPPPVPDPGVFTPPHPPLEDYPHPPMVPPMMGPETIPLEPYPPMSPPQPGPEDNAIVPMGPTHPQLHPDMMDNQPSAPPFFEGGPPPPPHVLQPSFHNYPGVITDYPMYHNATPFPQQVPQHFGYLYPDHVVSNFRPQLRSNSCQTTCPTCHYVVQTKVQKEVGTRAHLTALGMCLLLCWPFCLLPYCLDICKKSSHYCPRCGTFLGSYKK